MQQTQLIAPRKNTDIRIKTAFDIYNSYVNDKIIIHKTTRAGCTTALVAESLNRNEQSLVIVPTNHIAEKTIITDAKKYSDDKHNADIIHIPSNHKCLINEEMIERWPDLEKLPILPLAEKCGECSNFDICPVTAVIRNEGVDGVVLTYDKLAALMMAANSRPNTMAENIINKISQRHNVIFDEIHELQYGKSVSMVIYSDKFQDKHVNLEKYIAISAKYKYIMSIVVQFKQLLDDTQTKISILQAYQGAENEDFWKHKLSITLDNKYSEIEYLAGCSKDKAYMGIYSEIIELTKNRKEYNLSMKDIIILYDMMRIITNKRIVIHSIREHGHILVNLVAVDDLYSMMLRSFTMSIQTKTNRIMLTSATICNHDYDNYFMGNKPKKILFGSNGDPMNTNSKMLILADKKKYGTIGRQSMYKLFEEIVDRIIKIMDRYGDDNCIIITLNIREALKIRDYLKSIGREHPVTYYKSPEMMGVSSNARIMIAVGAADKPSNAYDALRETKEESLILREESMHCDTWQAWSRIKDPQGKENSIVFALGCTVEKCKNIVKWGINRQVSVKSDDFKREVNTVVNSRKISEPLIKKCTSFTMMLSEAEKVKQSKKMVISKTAKSPYISIIGEMMKNEMTIFSGSQLLRLFFARTDSRGEQGKDGKYFKVSGEICDTLLENHLKGKVTIGAYALGINNKVQWICFDVDAHPKDNDTEEDILKKQRNADHEKDVLCNFLSSYKVPYLLEASGTPHSYHIWIFVKPVEAEKAKYFGQCVLKECGIKKMEVFPKQTKITKNGYGNLVKLPFAINRKNGLRSKLWIDGEWKADFEELTVGAIDISPFKLPEVNKCECMKPTKKMEGVRLIFKWALNQTLVGSEGHWMRIAIVRENYNNGMTNPDELAELFKLQPDYNFAKSREKVLSIIKDDLGCWKWSTLSDRCSSFVKKFNEMK